MGSPCHLVLPRKVALITENNLPLLLCKDAHRMSM